MGILDYFTPEARRGNREWLDSQNAAISEALRYYLGPTGIPERLGLLAESTPTAGLERAGIESSRMFAPGLSGWDRMAAAGNMLSETAGAGAGLLGMPAAGRMADDLVEAAAPAVRQFGGDEFGGVPIPGNIDAAAQQGSEIINLLRSGRAGEVTEQMLDMGDPVLNARLSEYLYSNYDLPMDAASRMGRAEGMGADLARPLFRGDANPDLSQFNTGQYAREGIGVTSSTSPNVAATYMAGDRPAMYPLLSTPSRQLNIDVGGRSWTGISPNAPANDTTLANVLPPQSFLDEENLLDFLSGRTIDWGDGTDTALAVANTNDVSRAAQAQGFDEVMFNNIVDRGGAARFHSGPANDPQTTVMTSDPRNIRSRFARFARFDPRLSHLRNLNAALTAGVPLGLLAMQPDQGPQ